MAKHPAAYAHRVNKVTISGSCFNGQEEWSTGFYLGADGADAADPGSTTAEAIAPFWQTFMQSANSYIHPTYKVHSIKVSQLELDGDVDLDMIDIYDYPVAPAGASGGPPLPPQITLAATLTSDMQRGLASKGRMYLPGVNLPIFSSDPRISITEQTNLSNNLKTFFDAVNGSGTIAGSVILASKGRKTSTGPTEDDYGYLGGVNRVVTGLRIGNVYDTQRRRRGDLVESYVTKVLA